MAAYVLGRPMPFSSSFLDQRSFGKPRGRHGEMLFGFDLFHVENQPLGQQGHGILFLFALALGFFVNGHIKGHETGEFHTGAAWPLKSKSPHPMVTVF